MAERGAPEGNQNAIRGKEFREALQRALGRRGNGLGWRKALDKIADALVVKAEEGEQWAVQEVANRFDGKPSMEVEVKRTTVHEIPDDQLADAIIALQSLIVARGADSGTVQADSSTQTH